MHSRIVKLLVGLCKRILTSLALNAGTSFHPRPLLRGHLRIHLEKEYALKADVFFMKVSEPSPLARNGLPSLRKDMRLRQAHIGVIVTEAMSSELSRFGQIDGIEFARLQNSKVCAFYYDTRFEDR